MNQNIIVFFLLIMNFALTAQSNEISVHPSVQGFVSCMSSSFSVHGNVLPNQVSASQYDKLEVTYLGKNKFKLTTQGEGIITITISKPDSIYNFQFKVNPLPVKGNLYGNISDPSSKISVEEFKSAPGVLVAIVNVGFDAKCKVEKFEIIRIPLFGDSERVLNKGGRFTNASKAIISGSEGGDVFVFRQIFYKCPCDKEPHQLDDMTIEIAESIYHTDTISNLNENVVHKYNNGNGDTIKINLATGTYEIISQEGVILTLGGYDNRHLGHPDKNGAWIERYRNKQIKTIGSYYNSKKLHTWTYFYRNGNIKKIENYSFPYSNQKKIHVPLLSGPFEEFYEDGTRKIKGQYTILEYFHKTDTLITINYDTYEETPIIIYGDFWTPSSFKTGKWIFYDPKGERIKRKTETPLLGKNLRKISN